MHTGTNKFTRIRRNGRKVHESRYVNFTQQLEKRKTKYKYNKTKNILSYILLA